MTIAQSLATQLTSYTGNRELELYKALDNIAKLGLEDGNTQKLIAIACLTYDGDFRFAHANTQESLAHVLNQVLKDNQRPRIPSLPESADTNPSTSTARAFSIAHTRVHQNFPTEFAEKFMGKDELEVYNKTLIQDIGHPNLIKQGVMFGSIALSGKQHKQTLGEYLLELYKESEDRFDANQFITMISLMAQAPGNMRASDIKISSDFDGVDQLAINLYLVNAFYASSKRFFGMNKAHHDLANRTLHKIEEIINRDVDSDEKLTSLQRVFVKECHVLRQRGSHELLTGLLKRLKKVCKGMHISDTDTTYGDVLEDRRVEYNDTKQEPTIPHPTVTWYETLYPTKKSQPSI